MEWYQALLAIIGSFIFLIAIGIPINYALCLSFIPILFFFSGEPANYVLDLFALITFRKLNNIILIAPPLFVLMGQLFSETNVGFKLYEGFQRWLGWVPGGLAVATIGTNAMVAAIIGASLISVGATSPVSIPSMIRQGYDKRLAIGAESAGSTLAMLIPPSIPMIFYCIITEQSIGALFIAGIVPGLVMVTMFVTYIIIRVKRKPSLAPSIKMVSMKQRCQAIPWLAGPLGLVLIILISLYMGLASVNELGAIGVLGAGILGFCYRQLGWRQMFSSLVRTARFNAFFGIIFVCACFMGFGFAYYGISQEFSQWVTSLAVPRVIILLILMIMYLLFGMIMDASAIILVTMPFVLPIINVLGYDPIWFGVLLILNLQVGTITPPVGVNLFALKAAVPDIDLRDAIFGTLPFVGIVVIIMILIIVFPELALWLPSTR